MIEFLVCPVEIIVREPLIPLEAGSRKSGLFQAGHSKDWISSSKGSCQEEKSSGTETSSGMTTCLQLFRTEKSRSAGSDPCSPQL